MIHIVLPEKDLRSIVTDYLNTRYSKILDRDVKLDVKFLIDNDYVSADVTELDERLTNEEI